MVKYAIIAAIAITACLVALNVGYDLGHATALGEAILKPLHLRHNGVLQ